MIRPILRASINWTSILVFGPLTWIVQVISEKSTNFFFFFFYLLIVSLFKAFIPDVTTETLAIFVKETRAREHICITRGTVHTWEIQLCPSGIRVLSNSSHHITLPLRSHARSSGVCKQNPSRLLRAPAQNPLYWKTRPTRERIAHPPRWIHIKSG